MSGLAEILIDAGFKISGSDSKKSPLTEHLSLLGADVKYGQCAANIDDSIDLVVYTAAISKDNPEYIEAVSRNIPMMTRAALLGQIMKNYKTPIAISGTHGKTTTTSMISEILLADDLDPTLSIGGILKSIGGNIRVGKSEYFVTEACEYTNSFLSFFPRISIILNIEEDHLDFFKDINDIRNSFHKFAQLLPDKDGYLIINNGIDNLSEITGDLDCKVITFGKDNSSDYSYTDVEFEKFKPYNFVLHKVFYRHNDLCAGHSDIDDDGTVICSAQSGVTELDISMDTYDACYAAGDGYACEAGATPESMVSDACYAVGDCI